MSLTDPDASIVRHKVGKPKLQYKTHRAVDSLHEVITAVEVTTGSVNEAHKMASLIDDHTANTLTDSKYGTLDNLLECHDRGINPLQYRQEIKLQVCERIYIQRKGLSMMRILTH